jgi:predicted permease
MLADLLSRLRSFFRRDAAERELDEELRAHLEYETQKYMATGVSRSEAERRAHLALGGVEQVKEACRDARGTRWIEALFQDAWYAMRNVRRHPGSSLLAVGVLGATVGLNTTVFTVFTGIAMRPWAVADAVDVVQLFRAPVNGAGGPESAGGFSLSEFRYLADHSRSLHGVIAMQDVEHPRLGDEHRPVTASSVSGNYFDVLGIGMAAGRGFRPEDDRVEAPRAVAILGHHLWKGQFAGDPGIIGRVIRLDAMPFEVVGVAAPEFGGTNATRTDLWILFSALPRLRPFDRDVPALLNDPGFCCVRVAGRLAPRIDRDRARAELDIIDRQFTREHRQDDRRIVVTGTAFLSNPGAKRGVIVPAFGIMFAALAVVLLLACANVGALLLAQAAARRREVVVRMALGAGRGRLLRQFMTENLLLAGAAGLLGIGIAYVFPSFVLKDVLGQAVTFQLRPDVSVFAYTFVVAMLACLAFGLVPALQGTRVQADEVLREHTAAPGIRLRARNVLLAIQVMTSVVLLVSAGLLARGLHQARSQDPGFAAQDVSALTVELPPNAYHGPRLESLLSQFEQLVDQAGLTRSVGYASLAPFSSNRSQIGCHSSDSADRLLMSLKVSAAYFDVLRVPVVAGRNFTRGETEGTVIVNQALARRQWPDRNPVGQTLTCGGQAREVIGVAGDAYTWGLDQIEPTVYESYGHAQVPQLLVRTTDAKTAAALYGIVTRLDARITLRPTPLSAGLADSIGPAKAIAGLAGLLGTYALILATAGMFGVFAYVVQQRTPELGIRMALGAQPAQVTWEVMGNSARSIGSGLLAGFVCAIGASQLLTRYLYGVSPLDPLTYAVVILTMAVAAMAASYLPARRATGVDPITALRYQ